MEKSDEERWIKLNEVLAAIDQNDPHATADAIAAVYAALDAIPFPILQDFKSFTEAMLAGDVGERARKVAAGHIEVKLGADPTETMLDAARLLRSLEINMLEGRLFAPNDRGEDLEEAWITSDERHYVIPRISPLAPREGEPFLRRALLKCRVIPTK